MYRIGIDLGGTNIVAGIVDKDYKIVASSKMKTNAPRPAAEIFDDIAKVVFEALDKAGVTMDEIESIGMGTPGTVNKAEETIEFANNLKFDNVPAGAMLRERLGKTVYMDNDANCAALGEAKAGAGNGVDNFIAITLGTGVGSGVVVDGHILSGANYAAAEMGHMVIVVDGAKCTCGRHGCWESYASATALISQTREAMRHEQDSLMWHVADEDLNKVNGRTAFDAMRQGDAAAKKVVDRYIYYVACGLINAINIFQPEIICIGGGISHEGETLLEPLRRHIRRERYSMYSKTQTKICAAQLGNDAGVIGAALLDE